MLLCRALFKRKPHFTPPFLDFTLSFLGFPLDRQTFATTNNCGFSCLKPGNFTLPFLPPPIPISLFACLLSFKTPFTINLDLLSWPYTTAISNFVPHASCPHAVIVNPVAPWARSQLTSPTGLQNPSGVSSCSSRTAPWGTVRIASQGPLVHERSVCVTWKEILWVLESQSDCTPS